MGIDFDMDVASPTQREFCHVPAATYLTEKDNGLEKEWSGCVWMNPPYGGRTRKTDWIYKFVKHGNGVALLPDSTATKWWQYLAARAHAVLFIGGRVKFIKPDGTLGKQPTNGTCLFAMGNKSVNALDNAAGNALGVCYHNKIDVNN